MTIDLFTFITKNGADYAEYLKYTAELTQSGNHNINWKCVESLNVDRLPKDYKCVCKTGGIGEHNSMKHAIAMTEALKYIESEYVLFVDCDVAIVYPNWDEIIIGKLDKYHCFGGSYPVTKSKVHKTRYRNFPRVNFFSFRSSILKKVELDFNPFKTDEKESVFRGVIIDKKEESIFGLKIGSTITYDVGWKLPLIFKTNKLKYDYMSCFLNSKLPFLNEKNKEICNKSDRGMEEWHYKDKLFACHKKFARYHSLYSEIGLAWKERVDLYLKEQKGDIHENAI
jgi:hypothetical protein